MGRIKAIILSVLFLLINVFDFIQPEVTPWIGPVLDSIYAVAFIFLAINQWDGTVIDIAKSTM